MRYLIKHTTQTVCGKVLRLNKKIDINTFTKIESGSLHFNEIGEVQFELHSPIFCDLYEDNHATGSFILIDPRNNDTVAAGMITEAARPLAGGTVGDIDAGSRITLRRGVTVWFTGLSGAGKTTICRAVATELLAYGLQVEVIDGDVIRKHLCKDLGFSKSDRDENIRRIAFVARMLTRNGVVVLVSAISPYCAARDEARYTIGSFVEVYVNTPLEVCELRDAKDLYKKAWLETFMASPVSTILMSRRWRRRLFATPLVRIFARFRPRSSPMSWDILRQQALALVPLIDKCSRRLVEDRELRNCHCASACRRNCRSTREIAVPKGAKERVGRVVS